MTEITRENKQIFLILKIFKKYLPIILNVIFAQTRNHNRHQIELFAFHREFQKGQMHFQTVFIFLDLLSDLHKIALLRQFLHQRQIDLDVSERGLVSFGLGEAAVLKTGFVAGAE